MPAAGAGLFGYRRRRLRVLWLPLRLSAGCSRLARDEEGKVKSGDSLELL
jgi:hypothetical protein